MQFLFFIFKIETKQNSPQKGNKLLQILNIIIKRKIKSLLSNSSSLANVVIVDFKALRKLYHLCGITCNILRLSVDSNSYPKTNHFPRIERCPDV
jgi:hypothetical protein